MKGIFSSPAALGGEARAVRCKGLAAAGQELGHSKSIFLPLYGSRELCGITPCPHGVWQLMEDEYFDLPPAIT